MEARAISSAIPSCSSSPPVRISSRARWNRSISRDRVVASSGLIADAGPSKEEGDVPGFIKRMEQTWMISKQPKPVACFGCQASGKKECPWCKGTGVFVLGDNILCEISTRNTRCYICYGEGVLACDQCKGTGYRAKWLGQKS